MTDMKHRFVAINVGTGDSFFLQRGRFSALIDGGLVKGFPSMFSRATHASCVDVLVCTHNCQDHANGVLEFLDSGYGVGECWLPATWVEALRGLLGAISEETLFNLLVSPEGGDKSLPEKVERAGELISAEEVDAMLERESERDPEFDGGFWHPSYDVAFLSCSGRLRVISHQTVDIIVQAARIRRIAISASRRQIPIKWFDPSIPQKGAPDKPLNVVNATQVTAIKRSGLTFRDVIRLTQVNRDSLVLYSPPDNVAPGVLFSADSGFGFRATLPASPGMIVTAPHHGAADNRLKKDHRKLWDTLTWVRSDRATRVGHSRPCDRYRDQKRRFCTRCRGAGGVGQDIILVGGAGSWSSMGSPPCCCTKP